MDRELDLNKSILDKCLGCPYWEASLVNKGWCEKVGGSIAWYGDCTEYSVKENHKERSRKKRRNKRERDEKYLKHLKEIEPYTPYCFGSQYINKDYISGYGWYPLQKPYYKRIYLGRGRHHGESIQKYLKRQSNKRVRRCKDEISNGCGYKKLYEYWWQIY